MQDLTWSDLLSEGAEALAKGAGSARLDPRREAGILLRSATGLDAAALLAYGNEAALGAAAAQFRAWVDARARGVPLQHLVGETGFHAVTLRVEPGVFIPRPETELLVDAALEELARMAPPRAPIVLDLCTGSGTVAVAIAAAFAGPAGRSPGAYSSAARPAGAPTGPSASVTLARVFAGDIDPSSVALARRNAEANGVAHLVDVRESDLAAAFADLQGRVDILVANPPYIDPALADSLPVEVRFGDPPRALFDPEGGVGFHRRIAHEGRRLLRAGGCIFLEIGDDQGVQARRLLADEGYGAIRVVPDLAGRDRVACGRVEPSTQSS